MKFHFLSYDKVIDFTCDVATGDWWRLVIRRDMTFAVDWALFVDQGLTKSHGPTYT